MRSRVGELLVQSGALGTGRLEEAYRRQIVYGGALDTVLLEMNAVEESRLRAALAQAHAIEAAPEERLREVSNQALGAPLLELCTRLRVAPLGYDGDRLRILVCDSSEPAAARSIARVAGVPVEAWIVLEYRLTFELERRLGILMPPRYAALARRRLGALARDVIARRQPFALAGAPPNAELRVPTALDWGSQNGDQAVPTEAPPISTQPYASPDAGPPEPLPVRHDEPPALEKLAAWAQLAAAPSRDAIFMSLCELACARLEFAAVFTVHGPTAVLRVAKGLEDTERIEDMFVPLEHASAFRAAIESGAPYLGPVDPISRKALDLLGRRPTQALFLPIKVGGRVVAVLYGDHGERPPRSDDVRDLVQAATETGRAFQTLILRSKRAAPAVAGATPQAPKKLELAEIAPEYAGFYAPDREVDGGDDLAAGPAPVSEFAPEPEAPAEPPPEPVADAVAEAALAEEAPAADPEPAPEPATEPAPEPAAEPAAEPAPALELAPGPEPPPDPAPVEETPSAAAEPEPPTAEPALPDPPAEAFQQLSPFGEPQAVVQEVVEAAPREQSGNDLPPVAGSTMARRAAEPSPPRGPSVIIDDEPEPDAIAQIVATGSPEEAQKALDALVSLGANGLDALLRRFPGPLRVDRRAGRGGTMPPVVEHGAILRGVVRFGRGAITPLLRLLSHSNSDVRFYATYLFSELRYAEALPFLGMRLYDSDRQVRIVALDVLRRFSSGETREYREVLERLRGDLFEPDAERARLSAVALGELRDRACVPRLIELVKHRDGRVQDAAHQALLDITKQDFGRSQRRWRNWWEKNRARHRIEWMLDGLAHKAPEMRLSASEELKHLTHEYFGYHFDLPKREREEARRKWLAWWDQVGRKRYLDGGTSSGSGLPPVGRVLQRPGATDG